MIDIPDAPYIKNAMETGYMYPWEDDYEDDAQDEGPEWEPEMEWE